MSDQIVSHWIEVDQAVVDPPRKDRIRGVEITRYLSPNLVPEAVRATLDRNYKNIAFELRYLGDIDVPDERLKSIAAGRHAEAQIGAKSRKLYRLTLDGKDLDLAAKSDDEAPSQLGMRIQAAHDQLLPLEASGHATAEHTLRMYDAARTALLTALPKVVADLQRESTHISTGTSWAG